MAAGTIGDLFTSSEIGKWVSFFSLSFPDRRIIEERMTAPWRRETDVPPLLLRVLQSNGDLHHHTIPWTRDGVTDLWAYQRSELSFRLTD